MRGRDSGDSAGTVFQNSYRFSRSQAGARPCAPNRGGTVYGGLGGLGNVDKKWQLLSEPVTKDEFSSMALISEGFFKYFKTFSPDVQTLRNEKNIKIVMTFDKPIEN